MDALTGSGWWRLAQLRANAKADLVALIAWARNDHGIAKLYDYIIAAGNKDALSVVDSGVAVPDMTLSHEIAHNIGAGHYPNDRTGAYLDSQGWYYENKSARQVTIMGVVNVANHYRFNRFSNPDVRYEGEPTGFPNLADNAKTLNANRYVVAQFLNGNRGIIPMGCPDPEP
jgi:peptidyl-Asp metalloendopeptidase